MANVILGTAGHIDHGKTSLVRALTGTDTDRLKEEKARGITIELGFAELATEGGPHFGVVDVPGHEAFVRAMVAGAAGMDLVLLVVAADEGVMPQTREHLSIVELLGVPELVVALTKCDLVEEEWLELVDAEVAELLEPTRYAGAPRVPTSAAKDDGLGVLLETLTAAAERVAREEAEDLVRLPLDRVFTIQGTGTVVTGTLWSGTLAVGDRVRILPDDLQARIRSVQVHGREAQRAAPGERTAVALTGDGADRALVARGATLVRDPGWLPSRMLTARVTMLPDTGWTLKHNQRVHVHLGTAEVRARVALLEEEPLGPGDAGWVQLRLEEPVVARGRDRLVIRAYSPVTTIGGGVVAESHPSKRTMLGADTRRALTSLVDGTPDDAVRAAVDLAGWSGFPIDALPVGTGLTPDQCARVLESAVEGGFVTVSRAFGAGIGQEARALVQSGVEGAHARDPLLGTVPMSEARAALPAWAHAELADPVIHALIAEGVLEGVDGGVRRSGHEPTLTDEQARASDELLAAYRAAGLAAPLLEEFPPKLADRGDFWPLVRRLAERELIEPIAEGLYIATEELVAAGDRIRSELGGRSGLGPSDFRQVLPVTRKHLIPLLNYFDGLGTTVREGEGRSVPAP